jgi:TonB-dependent Receptor Plug Domain
MRANASSVFEKQMVIQQLKSSFWAEKKISNPLPDPSPKHQIDLQTDQATVAPRQKINLRLKVANADNVPLRGTYSVSVVDEKRQITNQQDFNIASYLSNKEAVEANLNKAVKDVIPPIMGVVRLKNSLQPIANVNVAFLLIDSTSTQSRVVKTDAQGRFKITDFDIIGLRSISYQVNDKKDRPNPKAEVVLDRYPSAENLSVLDFGKIPVSESLAKNWENIAQNHDGEEFRWDEKAKLLDEVKITAQKPFDPNTGMIKLYKEADAVVSFDENNRLAGTSIVEFFMMLPGVTVATQENGNYVVLIRGIGTLGSNNPLVLIDGMPFNLNSDPKLSIVNPRDVIRMELLSNPVNTSMFGSQGANGVIAIYTQRFGRQYKDLGLVQLLLVKGWQPDTPFYTPSYAQKTTNTAVADYRTSIYWNPEWVSNAQGEAECSFYAADRPTQYLIVVEGITADGQPLRAEKRIVVN